MKDVDAPFRLDASVLDVLGHGVAFVVGTASPELAPEVCRGWGPRWHRETAELEVLLPLPAARSTIDNLSRAPGVAFTFTSPTNYTCYQLKGSYRRSREPGADDWRRAREHFDAFLAEMPRVGLEPAIYSGWFPADGIVIRAHVQAAFDQAPGPRAGSAL